MNGDPHFTEEVHGALATALESATGDALQAAQACVVALDDFIREPHRVDPLPVRFHTGPADAPTVFVGYSSRGHELIIAVPGPASAFRAIYYGRTLRGYAIRKTILALSASWERS